MGKLFRMIACALLFSASLAAAAITVEFKFSQETFDNAKVNDPKAFGDRLHVDARILGIARGESFKYHFEWTSPNPDVFANSRYPSLTSTKELWAGDRTCAKCLCYCADTDERGCWRTRAYRTYSGEWSGKTFVASGVWAVALVRSDTGEVLGKATYEVK